LPEGTAFEDGKIYDFWYPAKNPVVLGIGYAAMRDLIAFLRYEPEDDLGNLTPVALSSSTAGIDASLAIGISQSGRALRHFIELGMNQDEAGRKVFDGVLPHISGAGKVFANHQFGHSFRTATRHQDYDFPENWFPFTYAALDDPITGTKAGLFRGDGFDPLVIETNTSTEYWQKSASLLHTDSEGQRDIELPDAARVYLIAGTQHGGRVGLSDAPGPCVNPRNPHNPAPALRALLVALDQWANEGIAPPPSQVPTIEDGTLVPFEAVKFPGLPHAELPGYVTEYGTLESWVDPKIDAGPRYASLVAQVDEDGNEVAGIRLPPIAVPLGTYTGWNVYPAALAAGELCDRDGSFIAFATTEAEREATGDPRPSLEARYPSRDDYVQKVSEAASALVQQRLLLPEDAARYVEAATREPALP
jgi:Alpha/beta hydrolase domain